MANGQKCWAWQGRVVMGACLLLMACQTNVAVRSPLRSSPVAKAVSGVSPSPLGSAVPIVGSFAPSSAPATQNRPTLFGTLQAPASLVRKGGGAVAGSNGGSLVSNNAGGLVFTGGGYRLLTVAQLPVANATIAVLDAAGKPILDANGRPLTAITNAQGEYALYSTVPAQNLVLRAMLPENQGAVQALAPKDSRGQAVALDLISTLTTTYIMERYVATQADRQVTLDRLPGKVEEDTRRVAAAAFSATASAPTDSLSSEAVLLAVENLRRLDKRLDDQMETVRRLLIVAGQSNLGEGLLATSVRIDALSGAVEAPDGSVYVGVHAGRIWRIRPDGTMEVVIGGGKTELRDVRWLLPKTPTALSARDVSVEDGLDSGNSLALDSKGRLIACLDNHLLRLEPDGKLTFFATDVYWRNVLAFAADGDDLQVLARVLDSKNFRSYNLEVWKCSIGSKALLSRRWAIPTDTRVNDGAFVGGEDCVFTLDASRDSSGLAQFYRWAPVGEPIRQGVAAPASDVVGLTHGGRLVVRNSADQLEIRDVTQSGLQSLVAFGLIAPRVFGGSDGQSLLVNDDNRLVKVTGRNFRHLAGIQGVGPARMMGTDLSLQRPLALCATHDGRLLVLDAGARTLYEISGTGLAVQRPLGRHMDWKSETMLLLADVNGVIWVVTDGLIAKLGDTGLEEPVLRETGVGIASAVLDGAGRIFFHGGEFDGTVMRDLYHLTPGVGFVRAQETGISDPEFDETWLGQVTLGPDGAYWFTGEGCLYRWRPGEDMTRPFSDGRLDSTSYLAFAPDGSLFLSGDVDNWSEITGIWRLDLQNGVLGVVAGENGVVFNGSDVDDSAGSGGPMAFNAAGDCYFLDKENRQIKRIPKAAWWNRPLATPKPTDDG